MFLLIILNIISTIAAQRENITDKDYCDRVLSSIGNSTNDTIVNFIYKTCCIDERRNVSVFECFSSVAVSNLLLHFERYEVIIHNYTPERLYWESRSVQWGSWQYIPEVIAPWTSESAYYAIGYFSGFEGSLRYSYASRDISINFFTIGVNHYYFHGVGDVTLDSSNKNVIYSWYSEKDYNKLYKYHIYFRLPENTDYSIVVVVSSDPQPWRLENDGDPNDQQRDWESRTEHVFREIKEENADFIIINGDMTEFGRFLQLKSIQKHLSLTHTAALWGLGNHDYFNNINDCATNFDWSKNACADFMINSLIYEVHKVYSYAFKNFEYDYDSLAYAWNYGKNIRYVQLNFFPLYEVTLDFWNRQSRRIVQSVDWLKRDMNKNKDKMYILNMHKYHDDSIDQFKDYFDQIYFIFVGHTHNAAVECHNGRKIYNSGALFKGDYFILKINEPFVSITYNKNNKVLYNGTMKKWTEEPCLRDYYL